ncbi:hypothetical protein KY289_030312 [Solanum tuberosum]|nr:hypothetical protein KY289_030312 [Solanum tuberosum]
MLLSSSLAGAAGIVAGLAVSPLLLEFARRGRRRGASARCLEQHRCWPELFSLALLVLFAGKENRREGGEEGDGGERGGKGCRRTAWRLLSPEQIARAQKGLAALERGEKEEDGKGVGLGVF